MNEDAKRVLCLQCGRVRAVGRTGPRRRGRWQFGGTGRAGERCLCPREGGQWDHMGLGSAGGEGSAVGKAG